jgi:type IV pilus assembly protein PilB
VRRLCQNCKQSYEPEQEEIGRVTHIFALESHESYRHIHQLEQQALKQNIGKEVHELGSGEEGIKKLWRPHDGGCNQCHGSGYKGRIGIYEVLAGSPEIQKLIVSNATSAVIQDEAIKEGMITMQVDGLIKALRGETSIQEVLRVTRE